MFIHLHNHSVFSILDGLGKVKDIVAKAKEQGCEAVAITDHASISSLTDLMSEAKLAGIKPIIGCEFFWVDDALVMEKGEKRNHLSVWAKNWNGVLSIMKHLTIANQQFYFRPRLSWAQCLDFEDCIIGTACAYGVMGRDDYMTKSLELIKAYKSENVYFEIMPYVIMSDGRDIQRVVTERIIQLTEMSGGEKINVLATCDSHYTNKEDSLTHEVLLAIQTGAAWDDPKRWRFDTAVYMMDEEEVNKSFPDYITALHRGVVLESITNTKRLADKINIEMPKFEVALPSPYKHDVISDDIIFGNKLSAGWNKLIKGRGLDVTKYGERLIYEMSVVEKLGFVKYFLIVEDIISWARDNNIMVGCARGSSAGSLICFLLSITQIDPIKHGLYFERFLNPERIDLPDIDVDFQDDRRDDVFAYIVGKYGADKTAHINTFSVLSIKSAFRDVCRVFGINALQVNILSKQIEDEESFNTVPALVAFEKAHKIIVEQSKKLSGVIRQQGVHACGFIVSSKTLTDVSVIEKRKDIFVVNWDKVQSEAFGLVKIDILGLSTLTILSKTLELVKKNYGIDIELTSIPLDDEMTLDAFSKGQGVGVFQFENSGMQGLLKSINANTFEAITNTTALFRPASLNSGQTESYVKICKGDEYEHYLCEQLKPILSPTKSIMVYQEQVMQIFNQLGGFTWAESDKMRKIIGKKLGKDEFEKHREHFVSGCTTNGIEEKASKVIFDKMVEFAAYGFNKSHAVAYSTISFWCMYLKVRYPLEFLAASMTFVSDETRVGGLIKEAQKVGIKVELPDINKSGEEYLTMPLERVIIAPLGCVKGVGQKAVRAILDAREAGVFLTTADLITRVERRVVNIRVVELLKRAGCFESLGVIEINTEQREKNFAELLLVYNAIPELSRKGEKLPKDILTMMLAEPMNCARAKKKLFIPPKVLGVNPTIMVINNPVKGETSHLTNEGSRYFLTALKAAGLTSSMIYYTSPMKCLFPKITEAPKECQTKCLEYLKKEIEIVKPKLILCFASNALRFFGQDEQMGKASGKLVYSKEFSCYILFSYSPQYAYFQEDRLPEFLQTIEKLKEIFN